MKRNWKTYIMMITNMKTNTKRAGLNPALFIGGADYNALTQW